MIKLIGLDIDGTIMRKNKVNAADVAAIKKAMDAGIKITIATGRSVKSIYGVAEKLGILNQNVPMIGQNGGQIFIFNEDKSAHLIFNKVFETEETRILFELAKKFKVKVFAYCEDEDVAYSNVRFGPFIYFMKSRSHRKSIKYNKDSPLKSPVSKLIVFGSKKRNIAFREEVEKLGYPVFAFSYVSNAASNVEVVPKGLNKGVGLAKLAEILELKPEEVMFFGDGENDMAAIEWAGIGIAMGNAKNDVKAVANKVTGAFAEAGVSQAILEYLNQ